LNKSNFAKLINCASRS